MLSYQPLGVKRMTMTNKTIEPQLYDVWQIPFEYEDQPGIFKKRPVIIGGVDTESVEIFLLSIKVTSHPPRSNYVGEVPILDWKDAGLSKPSTARCSHIVRLPKSFFQGKLRYGHLSDRDAQAIEKVLTELGYLR